MKKVNEFLIWLGNNYPKEFKKYYDEFEKQHVLKKYKFDYHLKCTKCGFKTQDPESDLITIDGKDYCNDCASKL